MNWSGDILVFSDLDGTILDHQSYVWDAARPAMRALRANGAGLVLASSKTAAEMAPLRAQMGFADWPAIIENGAGLLAPDTGDTPGDSAAAPYADLRAKIKTLPPGFRGFGDMTDAEVAEITGLSLPQARLARERRFSEPGLWQGSDAEKRAFLDAAQAAGLAAQQGGRFLTLSFGATKADQMEALIAQYRPRITLALGDAPNDIAMLTRADYGVIIANPAATPIPEQAGERSGRIIRQAQSAPAGWATAVTEFLNDHAPSEG